MEIKHLQQRLGVTMVYVTHDQVEALTMSDRIAVFTDGQLRQSPSRASSTSARIRCSSPSSSARATSCPARCASATAASAASRCPAAPASSATTVGAAEKVSLAIRPEKVALGPASSSCVNHYPAKVLEVSFLGDQLRVRLAALGREDFIVKLANAPGLPALERAAWSRSAGGRRTAVRW